MVVDLFNNGDCKYGLYSSDLFKSLHKRHLLRVCVCVCEREREREREQYAQKNLHVDHIFLQSKFYFVV